MELSEHTIINDKRGLFLLMYAHELFMHMTNTLPPQEYFDKTYGYSYLNYDDRWLYGFWEDHKEYIEKFREYVNDETFTSLIRFLTVCERRYYDREYYFTKTYIDIAKQFVVDVFDDSGCVYVPKVLKVDGWQQQRSERCDNCTCF